MKNDCTKWKDALLEAALTGIGEDALEEHVLDCANCAEQLAALRVRREQLDRLLPLVAQGAQPSPGFHARLLARMSSASEAKHGRWRVGGLCGAMAMTVAALIVGLTLHRRVIRTVPENELAAAEKLAEWRAPSDVLLETPGRTILRTMPRLGDSYLHVPMKTDQEE